MLRTVQLYNDLYFCDIEIRNIVFENFLTINGNRKSLQKIIPKASFFFGHIASKRL